MNMTVRGGGVDVMTLAVLLKVLCVGSVAGVCANPCATTRWMDCASYKASAPSFFLFSSLVHVMSSTFCDVEGFV